MIEPNPDPPTDPLKRPVDPKPPVIGEPVEEPRFDSPSPEKDDEPVHDVDVREGYD